MTTDVTLAERPPLYDGFLAYHTVSEILGTDYGRLTEEIDKGGIERSPTNISGGSIWQDLEDSCTPWPS